MEALVDAISAKLSSDPKVTRVGREVSPVGSHQSNGAAEVAVQLIEGMARTSVLVVEEKYKCKVTVRSPILPWIVRHASYVYNRFQTKKNGRTPYEVLTMQKFKSPLLEFGEVVLKRD